MKNRLTWRQAFLKSSGPKSFKDSFILFLKGLCMGGADIIPGVSGGTIAFITGIYDDLLNAIRSFNARFFKDFLSFNWKQALAESHLRFLITLLLGIGIAIISIAQIIHHLLLEYPILTGSFFFGLVLASVFAVGKSIPKWTSLVIVFFILGVIVATWIVNLIPVQTPESLWFIFLCGVIAICAMILPGISGSFILLILGKYIYITGTLKNPFTPHNFTVILVFCAGAIVGILAFSHVLSYFLKRFRVQTLGFLTGLVLGAIQKIWPWQQLNPEGFFNYRLTLPPAFNGETALAFVLMIIGFLIVFLLEKAAGKKPKTP